MKTRELRRPAILPDLSLGGGGAPIALLHANGFPPGAYGALGRALAPWGELRGLRQRPLWPGEPSDGFVDWWPLAADALAWLDQISPAAPVRAIGHSLGAVAFFYAALTAPERFQSLVLIEPVFLPPALLARLAAAGPTAATHLPLVQGALQRRDHWPDRAAAFAHLRPKPVFGRFGDAALWDYVAAGTVPVGADAVGAVPVGSYTVGSDTVGSDTVSSDTVGSDTVGSDTVATSAVGSAEAGPDRGGPVAGVTLACPRHWEARIYACPPLDVWDLLGGLTVPTLGLRGAETDTLTPEAWALWRELQPRASFRELVGLGHLLPLEDGAAVGAAIGAWWQAGGA